MAFAGVSYKAVLAATLVDTAGAGNDWAAAREAETVVLEVLAVREKLLKADDWRLRFARTVLAAAKGELARLDPGRDGESRRAALRETLRDIEGLVSPLLGGDMPMPTLALRLPACMLALARLHEAVGEFEAPGEHQAAARALREQVAALRVRPLD